MEAEAGTRAYITRAAPHPYRIGAAFPMCPDRQQIRTRPRWETGSDNVALVETTELESVTSCV